MKFRIISRRYIRKLSEEPPRKGSENNRKVSWGEEIDVIVFDKEDEPKAVEQSLIVK